jgi:septum formation protein
VDNRTKGILIASPSYSVSEVLKRANLMFMSSYPDVDRSLWNIAKGSHSDKEVREASQLVADLELENVIEKLDKELSGLSSFSLPLEESSLEKIFSSSSFRRDVKLQLAISSYTLLYKEGRILVLPNNAEEARRFMEDIRGRHIEVYTAFSLLDIDTRQSIKEVVVSGIKIRDMTDALIEHYLSTAEVYLSASSMFFNKGSSFIEASIGDPNNLYGMSLDFLLRSMRVLGYEVNQFWKV